MDSIGNRIRTVRKENGLTLVTFGERIGITNPSLSAIENGKTNPSTQTVMLICREFGVNETWLRTGEGEKYMHLSRRDAVAAYVGKILGGKVTPLESALIEFMAQTSAQEWEELASILKRLTDTIAGDEKEEQD